MARYLRAFDLTVAAAGYNAFHELLHLGVPTLFVPMPRELDDQGARARWAQREGAGLAVEGPDAPDLEDKLGELLDAGSARADLRARATSSAAPTAPSRPPARSRTSPTQPAPVRSRQRRQGWRYRPFFYAWMLARVPAHHLFGFGYRVPRAVCDARGVPSEELAAALERLPDELGERPERILVVTDAGDLAPLRRAGFAIEYVPAAVAPREGDGRASLYPQRP